MTGSIDRVGAVVIGAGVVGLAVARHLALAGLETIVLEAADGIGTGTSSRNSEVIHAGIYYPPGSLKARHCVAGRHALMRYCAERGVTARAIGKLIVATEPSQAATLESIAARARANGVDDLVTIDAREAGRLEPDVACVAALWSPSSGIVDSHGFMLALQGDLEDAGGALAFETPFARAEAGTSGFVVETGGEHPFRLGARALVNAAGLHAPTLARRVAGLPPEQVPPEYYCKGNYFALTGVRAPFTHLVYPVPEQAGLGIHATIDLGGQVRFGPDVEWVAAPDYAPQLTRLDAFERAIRTYWPALPKGALIPTYAGVRPKITGPGEPAADFVIQGAAEHGIPGLVNLFGIESPGLTSSLSIAEHVAGLLRGDGLLPS